MTGDFSHCRPVKVSTVLTCMQTRHSSHSRPVTPPAVKTGHFGLREEVKETWIGNARKAAAFDQLLQEWARSKISLVNEQIDLEIESQSYRLGHIDSYTCR